jgi:hypothetical protein
MFPKRICKKSGSPTTLNFTCGMQIVTWQLLKSTPSFSVAFPSYDASSVKPSNAVRKITLRCACALWRGCRCFRYKYIEHNLRTGHECILLRPSELTADNGAFYARKEGYMASWGGIERESGHGICVDVRLFVTTSGITQTSAILVLLHEYARVFGAYTMGILCHGTNIVIYVWLCEGVIYHTPGGISSLLTTCDSPISPHKIMMFI